MNTNYTNAHRLGLEEINANTVGDFICHWLIG